MPALYRRWAKQGATFHFVSSSPWHLYEPIDEFLSSNDFPPRSLSLKLVRLTDKTLFDLFKEGTETKPAQIEPILARFPGRRFVLVGDSGAVRIHAMQHGRDEGARPTTENGMFATR